MHVLDAEVIFYLQKTFEFFYKVNVPWIRFFSSKFIYLFAENLLSKSLIRFFSSNFIGLFAKNLYAY